MFEHLGGFFAGFAVDAHIGHGVEPLDGGRVQGIKVGDLQARQKILFDIADAVFNPALFIALAHSTGGDAKAVMVGKVKILGI